MKGSAMISIMIILFAIILAFGFSFSNTQMAIYKKGKVSIEEVSMLKQENAMLLLIIKDMKKGK